MDQRKKAIEEIKAQWPEKLRGEWVDLSEGSSTLDGNFSVEELRIVIQSMEMLAKQMKEEGDQDG